MSHYRSSGLFLTLKHCPIGASALIHESGKKKKKSHREQDQVKEGGKAGSCL